MELLLFAVAIRRGKGWVNMPEPGNERAPPILSPSASGLMRILTTQKSPQNVWDVLDDLPRGIGTWENILEVVAELRRIRNWRSVIVVCNLYIQCLS